MDFGYKILIYVQQNSDGVNFNFIERKITNGNPILVRKF